MSKNSKVFFITGSSRGFGLLMVNKLLEQGHKVVATARNPESLVETLDFSSDQLLVLPLDVTNEEQAKDVAKLAVEKFGKIDVLINNAGYGILGGVEETSAEEVEKNYATNVFGLLKVTKAVLPYMREKRSGHIINISSIGGIKGFIGWGVYCSTKFAVEGLSESLAQEVSPFGINVTIIEPGFFRTNFLGKESLLTVSSEIEDYSNSVVGQMRKDMAKANNNQPGNPEIGAQKIIDIALVENPPLRLMLGSDTLQVVDAKIEEYNKEMNQWRHVSISTDYND